jgi:outer membrane protein assembly factor BamB
VNPDGSLKWKFDARGIVDASPAIGADGTIYFGSHDKNFYALNPDGSVRWKFATGGEIVASPAIGREGEIYFSSLDGNVYALTAAGAPKWQYHTGGCTRSSAIVDASGNIVIGNNRGIDIIGADGKAIHRRGADFPVDLSVASVSGCYDAAISWSGLSGLAADGKTLWQARLDHDNVTASPVIGPRNVVYVCADQALYAIQPPGEPLSSEGSAWPMFQGNARHTGRAGN